ncbi:putative protein phosphatase 2C 59 [Diplonema papillatum]|nr:putative protein phosphatase 2C 59 [Diplonema papillatum]
MSKAEPNNLFGSRTLTLFECQVPLNECNIQLGSRRKSLDTRMKVDDAAVSPEDLPYVMRHLALDILQNGRPDNLLTAEIYSKVNEACQTAVADLLRTNKEVFDRKQVLKACQKGLESSKIQAPLHHPTAKAPRVESFTATAAGTCHYQEDRAIRIGFLNQMCGVTPTSDLDYLIGVYDGHGGKECSEFIVERLFQEIAKACASGDMLEGIKKAHEKADADFIEKKNVDAGCTALTVLLRSDKMWYAGAGDCRAVLCRKDASSDKGISTVQLTTDHNVKNPLEVEAVVERGGTILRNRVNGVLCVTRALGNRPCRELISQVPDVDSRPIDYQNDVFLVIGSDGLFDHTSNDSICETIMTRKQSIDESLRQLRAEAPISRDETSLGVGVGGLTLEQAQAYLKCSYQTIVDELVQQVTKSARGYCDNTTAVILFFDTTDCLCAAEVAAASDAIHKSHCKSPSAFGGTPAIDVTNDDAGEVDMMETSILHAGRPTM